MRSHQWSYKFISPGIRVVQEEFRTQLLTEKGVTRGLSLQVTRTTEEPGFCPLPSWSGLLFLSTPTQNGGCVTCRIQAVLVCFFKIVFPLYCLPEVSPQV